MLTRSPGWNGPRFRRCGNATFFYRRVIRGTATLVSIIIESPGQCTETYCPVDLFDADPMGAVQTAFLTHRLAKRAEDLIVGR